MKVLFSDNFYQYLIKIENKIKKLLEGLKYKLKRFFEKIYKIRVTVMVLGLFRLMVFYHSHFNPYTIFIFLISI